MDRLDAMKLFMRVAETGSFSGVAMQMDVARSVVTRQIAGLEAHLGTKLIAPQHATPESDLRRIGLSRKVPGNIEFD